ncbi:MAG TPA: nucleic acid-binding protein [Iamia sp.]|nr:nucleic acid-binding protein [Iamia sp.]
MYLVLDSGPLGAVTRPTERPVSIWLAEQVRLGLTVVVPEMADYEVRRELHRAGKEEGLLSLDLFNQRAFYLALDSATMELAAMLWADARRAGRPTAPDHALDADVILAAQANALAHRSGEQVVVATTNPKHLARFCDARRWDEI